MFNELETIRERLLAYIESAYHLSNSQLVTLRREVLEQPEILCHAPFIESSAKYAAGKPYSELNIPAAASELLTHLAAKGTGVFPEPYEHQAGALESVLGDALQHTIVTTGTGSGKTETFLLPILGRLATEARESTQSFNTRAVRALLLYPMNALVNDQLSRLRLLIGSVAARGWFTENGGRPVKFGRYTSRTPFPGVVPDDNGVLANKLAGLKFFVNLENAAIAGDTGAIALLSEMRKMGKWPAKDEGDAPGMANWWGKGYWKANGSLKRAIERAGDSELLTRHEIQAAPPDVLVTNYSMLEYMMLRPIERRIFDETRHFFNAHPDQRFILVLDEAHLYRGAQGTEVAMLIRRLRERLGLQEKQFQVITTSASFNNSTAAKQFAAGLSGVDTGSFHHLPGQQVPVKPSGAGTQEQAKILADVDLQKLLSGSIEERFAAIAPLGGLPGAGDVKPAEGNGDATSLAKVLHNFLAKLPVTGRLLNLTSGSRSPADAETQHDLGAQELSALAARLFPDVETGIARKATDVLVEGASIARETAAGAPLMAARVHRFFRGITGIWACSDPQCSSLPAEMQGEGPTGRLYVQPQRVCTCGARVFEMHACQSCGTPFLLAYTRNPRRPSYLWHEDTGEVDGVDGAVTPIHLWLENSIDLNINPDDEADVREMDLEPLTGRLFEDAGDSETCRPVCLPPEQRPGPKSGLFTACPRCRHRWSRISDLATKGDEPFQYLLTAQLFTQPPQPQNQNALKGRKLLVFSDGRQPASRLAGKLKENSLRDAVRPLLIHGLQYVADRWYNGSTAQVSLEHAYLSLMLGAASRGVELRPQLLASEPQAFYQHVGRVKQIFESNSYTVAAFESESHAMGGSPPDAILIAIYEVLFNPLSGVHSLALGVLKPRLQPHIRDIFEQLPIPDEPAVIANADGRREALLEFWIHRMARHRAVYLPGTNGDWIGNNDAGARVRLSSGKFSKEITKRCGRNFYNQQIAGGQGGQGNWRQFYADRLSRSAQGSEFLLDAVHLALDVSDSDWLRCSVCTSVMPASPFLLGVCPECKGDGSFEPLSVENEELFNVFDTRKGFFRGGVVDSASSVLRPFVAEEHTAAIGALDKQDTFSRAEWHEMRFQDLELEGPNGEPGSVVDVLSCTTTMEVGIDIGSLTAVSLRNVPPNRANYQQRAGRAGRRGSSLSTVITYADQGTHDQRYFAKPAEMISGPVTDPVLNLDNSEIVRRHGYALILSMFQQERIPASTGNTAEMANIFSSLGRVRNFRSGEADDFSFAGLENWLKDNRDTILAALRKIAPAPYLQGSGEAELLQVPQMLLQQLAENGCGETEEQEDEEYTNAAASADATAAWDEIIEDDDPVGVNSQPDEPTTSAPPDYRAESADTPRKAENLLDLLFDTAMLPSYAFPTDVVSLTVFDRERSTEYRPVIKYAPQRGLDLALSSYAPGREVFIDGLRHYSFAIWSQIPRRLTEMWTHRELYFECHKCGFAALHNTGGSYYEGQFCDCPSCKTPAGMGPGIYWIVPAGFAHPVDMPEDLAMEEPPDATRPTQAKLNASFAEADKPGKQLKFGDRSFTCWSAKEKLFLTNRGPEEQQNRGFLYCLNCGRIEPRGWQSSKSVLGAGGTHVKPFPNHKNKPNCKGFLRTVSLGVRFPSDVALFRFQFAGGVQLPPGSSLAKFSLTTVAQALNIVAADMLEIDRGNIGAEYRVAQTHAGDSGEEVDVYLYDNTPGGAGFVRAASTDPERLMRKTLELLEGCDCEGSCYKCLRSYVNRFLHPVLDRGLAAAVLRHVFNLDAKPTLDPATEDRLLRVLAQDLQDSGEKAELEDGYIVLPARNKRRIALAHALLPLVPGSPRAEAALATGSNNALPVDHLRVERALPAAIADCLGTAAPAAKSSDPPGGLKLSATGVPLHSFATLADGAGPLAKVSLELPEEIRNEAFVVEIDGPQIERLTVRAGDIEISLQQGTLMVFTSLNQPAAKVQHDKKPLLVRSPATFNATRTRSTFGKCHWQKREGRDIIKVLYRSTGPRGVPESIDPGDAIMVGQPEGVIYEGSFRRAQF